MKMNPQYYPFQVVAHRPAFLAGSGDHAGKGALPPRRRSTKLILAVMTACRSPHPVSVASLPVAAGHELAIMMADTMNACQDTGVSGYRCVRIQVCQDTGVSE
jgi:hypothetical protein